MSINFDKVADSACNLHPRSEKDKKYVLYHDKYKPNRRNVICYSNLLQSYIILNGLKNDNSGHSTIIIRDIINKNTLIDI